ncbi:MAG: penicillin acylase family protein, partial [Candidatus Angelobacter sp.]
MATSYVAASPGRRKTGKLLKTLLAITASLVLLIGVLLAWLYQTARASLPRLDGSISIPGLSAPVTVLRDTHGVPHITAATPEDLFLAQGYITAQDRLWQMDMTRRSVAGDLAEILPASSAPPAPPSPPTAAPRPRRTWVDYDKQQRILRLRAVAERVAAQLPARDRKLFDAYTRGVNAYITQSRGHLPLEFRLLHYSPRPWTMTDSVLVGIGMSQLLNPQYETEYWREKLGRQLSPELMADLYPSGSWRDHAPADDAQPQPALEALQGRPQVPGPQPSTPVYSGGYLPPEHDECQACLPGSNDWVVSGAHTVSGKPLLSNDMHLPHHQPGVWYEVHLHSGNFNVEGFS